MRPMRRLAVLLFVCVFSVPAIAAAQAPLSAPSVGLVSPGGLGSPTLTTECPTFSWAPGDSVSTYELSVFELAPDGKPRAVPALHVAVSGRASTWTPPANSCLSTGHQYGWYMREIKQQGDKPGKWSDALAFTVTAAATSTGETGGTGGTGGTGAAQPGVNAADKADKNKSVTEKLDDIIVKLDELLNPVTQEICAELGAELELGLDGEVKLAGALDAGAGAKAFGNGFKAWLATQGELKFAAGFKGAGAIKKSLCWEPLKSVIPASARAASVSATVPLSDAELIERLTAISGQLQLGDDRMRAALDALPAFSMAGDPWSSFRSTGPLTTFADVLPMPESMRAVARDPGQIVANFKAQLNLCAQSDLPSAVAAVVTEFCGLANTERFGQLLDRVDLTVQNVKSGVDGTRTVVNNINSSVNSLRNKVDEFYCKFFCGPN